MPSPCTALILQLSGCLVDFGARTLPVALQRLHPEHTPPNLAATPQKTLDAWLGKPPTAAQRQALQQTLSEVAGDHAELTPGAAQLLQTLHATDTPCAWLDDLPADASLRLAEVLPTPIEAVLAHQARPWPAPDSCWQALSQLDVERLDGCIVVSGNPLLLHHRFHGTELRADYARGVLEALFRIWKRPVNIETILDKKGVILTSDGREHTERAAPYMAS